MLGKNLCKLVCFACLALEGWHLFRVETKLQNLSEHRLQKEYSLSSMAIVEAYC